MSLRLIIVIFTALFSASSAQFTNVSCSSNIQLQDVTFDPTLYTGSWYTLSTCSKCKSIDNVCGQVNFNQPDSSSFDLIYTGSLADGVTSPAFQAEGNLTFLQENANTWNPAYNLTLDLGIPAIYETSRFWILATEKDSSGNIGLIVTYSCLNLPGTDANAQIFFLSRYPVYYDNITYTSAAAKAKLGRIFSNVIFIRKF